MSGSYVVATAGHVDHGKSTLVLALTGTDPDRLAEEKARGLTIDLGFASTTLPSGSCVGFVDVPGHARFIRNMLAGVGAVDACLFVVAANEGWKPQSEEHLRILELLGVKAGIVVLTKVAGLDADSLELARLEVGEAVAGTFLAEADVVAVDAPAGRGLLELRVALERLVGWLPRSPDRGRPRLWVDRSFPAKGTGTVVTGTLIGGSLSVGSQVILVREGATASARLRGLQSHGSQLGTAGAGRRLALNLAGIRHREVRRGNAVVLAGQWEPTRTFDASLSVLARLGHEVTRRGAYQVHLGSGEYQAKVRLLGAGSIGPGESGLVRLHTPVALPLLPGDRFVLRESGRAETVGGGEILDVAPVLPASRARPDRSVDRVIAERGWIEVDLLERLTGERRDPDLGRWCVGPAERRRVSSEVREAVSRAGSLGLDLAELDDRQRALVEGLDDLVVEGRRATMASAPSPASQLSEHPFLEALGACPFTPPEPVGVERATLREMARLGLVVERDGFWFASSALDRAAEVVADLLTACPSGVTVAQVRDALGTTRRWLLPILGHLDATGLTRRRGDLRVAGPRLSRPGALPRAPRPN